MSRRGARVLPSKEYLQSWYSYDPNSGIATWIQTSGPRAVAGVHLGVERVTVPDYGVFEVSHVIWKLMTGEDVPSSLCVDHRDRDPSNNKWDNLRLATFGQNTHNTNRKPGESGARGIRRMSLPHMPGRFMAYVRVNGERIKSPIFTTIEEAVEARKLLVAKHFGNFYEE